MKIKSLIKDISLYSKKYKTTTVNIDINGKNYEIDGIAYDETKKCIVICRGERMKK